MREQSTIQSLHSQMMKRIAAYISILLCTLSIHAQMSHLQFLGLPIDGKIKTFEKMLTKKYIVPDKEVNSYAQPGMRYYKGGYKGYSATIVAYYTPKTKTVYRVKVIIPESLEKNANARYDELKSDLIKEHVGAICYIGTKDGHEALGLGIKEDNEPEPNAFCTGDINLFLTKEQPQEYAQPHVLHIDYIDSINKALKEIEEEK